MGMVTRRVGPRCFDEVVGTCIGKPRVYMIEGVPLLSLVIVDLGHFVLEGLVGLGEADNSEPVAYLRGDAIFGKAVLLIFICEFSVSEP